MPVDAILVYGRRLYYSEDGSNYTELTDMKKVGNAPVDEPEVDVTPLADSADYRQVKLGLAKGGELECGQYFNKTRYAALAALTRRTSPLYWRVRFPDASVVANQSKAEFRGWLKIPTWTMADDPDTPEVIDFKVLVTGAVTFTAGT